MPFVTLTTDFGLVDHAVGAFKGALLSANPELRIVDITHNVRRHDIVQAAYLFRNAWPAFPQGTVHLVDVQESQAPVAHLLVLAYEGHFFIGPDNGIFSLIFDPLPEQRIFAPLDQNPPALHPTNTYVDLANKLSRGLPVSELGEPADELVQRITFQPVIGPAQIRGAVIYVDHYENAVVNIDQNLFEQVGRDRPFALYFKRNDPIRKLCKHYREVPVGEPLCLFNTAGMLEIAINMGKASSLLGLQVDDTVQVEFLDA